MGNWRKRKKTPAQIDAEQRAAEAAAARWAATKAELDAADLDGAERDAAEMSLFADTIRGFRRDAQRAVRASTAAAATETPGQALSGAQRGGRSRNGAV